MDFKSMWSTESIGRPPTDSEPQLSRSASHASHFSAATDATTAAVRRGPVFQRPDGVVARMVAARTRVEPVKMEIDEAKWKSTFDDCYRENLARIRARWAGGDAAAATAPAPADDDTPSSAVAVEASSPSPVPVEEGAACPFGATPARLPAEPIDEDATPVGNSSPEGHAPFATTPARAPTAESRKAAASTGRRSQSTIPDIPESLLRLSAQQRRSVSTARASSTASTQPPSDSEEGVTPQRTTSAVKAMMTPTPALGALADISANIGESSQKRTSPLPLLRPSVIAAVPAFTGLDISSNFGATPHDV
jgi:hypothetical protein